MIYVALLRGINVGGNNKIVMQELKTSFEHAGMQSVKTYINSGNIIFKDSRHTDSQLVSLLEKAILKDFKLSIKVVIRSFENFKKIMKAVSTDWTNDASMKSDILFLWENIDKKSIVSELPVKDGVDRVSYVPGAVLWNIDRKNQTRSGLIKIVGTPLYKQMTVRNVNTVRKIFSLMQEL